VTNITFILQDAANDKIKVSRYGRTHFFSPILPHTHTHTHIHTYTHTHVHTYIHTHTYTHTHTQVTRQKKTCFSRIILFLKVKWNCAILSYLGPKFLDLRSQLLALLRVLPFRCLLALNNL
jgi:hypothetical protein